MHFALCFWYILQTRGITLMMVLKYHVQKLMHVAIYAIYGVVIGMIGSTLLMLASVHHNEGKIKRICETVIRIEDKIKCSGTNQCSQSITPITTNPTKYEIGENVEEIRRKLQEISKHLDQISKQTSKATGRGKMPKGYQA